MDEQLCLGIFRPDESTVLRCLLCGEFLVVEFLKIPFSYAKRNFEPSEPHSLMKNYFYKNGVLQERHGEGS